MYYVKFPQRYLAAIVFCLILTLAAVGALFLIYFFNAAHSPLVLTNGAVVVGGRGGNADLIAAIRSSSGSVFAAAVAADVAAGTELQKSEKHNLVQQPKKHIKIIADENIATYNVQPNVKYSTNETRLNEINESNKNNMHYNDNMDLYDLDYDDRTENHLKRNDIYGSDNTSADEDDDDDDEQPHNTTKYHNYSGRQLALLDDLGDGTVEAKKVVLQQQHNNRKIKKENFDTIYIDDYERPYKTKKHGDDIIISVGNYNDDADDDDDVDDMSSDDFVAKGFFPNASGKNSYNERLEVGEGMFVSVNNDYYVRDAKHKYKQKSYNTSIVNPIPTTTRNALVATISPLATAATTIQTSRDYMTTKQKIPEGKQNNKHRKRAQIRRQQQQHQQQQQQNENANNLDTLFDNSNNDDDDEYEYEENIASDNILFAPSSDNNDEYGADDDDDGSGSGDYDYKYNNKRNKNKKIIFHTSADNNKNKKNQNDYAIQQQHEDIDKDVVDVTENDDAAETTDFIKRISMKMWQAARQHKYYNTNNYNHGMAGKKRKQRQQQQRQQQQQRKKRKFINMNSNNYKRKLMKQQRNNYGQILYLNQQQQQQQDHEQNSKLKNKTQKEQQVGLFNNFYNKKHEAFRNLNAAATTIATLVAGTALRNLNATVTTLKASKATLPKVKFYNNANTNVSNNSNKNITTQSTIRPVKINATAASTIRTMPMVAHIFKDNINSNKKLQQQQQQGVAINVAATSTSPSISNSVNNVNSNNNSSNRNYTNTGAAWLETRTRRIIGNVKKSEERSRQLLLCEEAGGGELCRMLFKGHLNE